MTIGEFNLDDFCPTCGNESTFCTCWDDDEDDDDGFDDGDIIF